MLKKNDGGEVPATASSDREFGLSGRRRTVDPVKAMRFPRYWPSSIPAQDAAIRDWHDIAAQIIHAERLSFRLLSAVPFCISRETGEIWESDEALASASGNCDKKTISRDIAAYKAAGILMAEYGWRDRGGKQVRTRKMRLSVPYEMPPYVVIRDVR
jgi:hypothetical protein